MEKFNKSVVPAAKRPRLQLESQESTLEEHFPIFELPEEILMKIMGYLSTYDILRIIAPVCKKFWQISRDPFLIKSIKLRAQLEDLTEKEEEKLCGDFSDVVRRSEKLKFLSFNFIGWDERIFLAIFPSINGHLEEFWMKFDSMSGRNLNFHCWIWRARFRMIGSNLKILKIDFDKHPLLIRAIGPELRFKNLTFENLKVLDLKFNQDYSRQPPPMSWYLGFGWAQATMQQIIFSSIISITKFFPKFESLRLSLWLEQEGIEEWVTRNGLMYKFYNGVSQIALEKISIVDLFKQ